MPGSFMDQRWWGGKETQSKDHLILANISWSASLRQGRVLVSLPYTLHKSNPLHSGSDKLYSGSDK